MITEITRTDVEKLINHFYELIHSNAYLADFFEILDENITLTCNDIVFAGYRGFEDHKQAKQAFFDEIHDIKKMEVDISNNTAIVRTDSIWEASSRKAGMPQSDRFKAGIKHTWHIALKQGVLKIVSQNVDNLEFIEGQIPDYIK